VGKMLMEKREYRIIACNRCMGAGNQSAKELKNDSGENKFKR
jgi:hypothetical protein